MTHTTTTELDVAWLIELPQAHRDAGPEYWSAIDHDGDHTIYGWDRNVKYAMRFFTEKAAQTYIDVFAIEHRKAVEHAWIGAER